MRRSGSTLSLLPAITMSGGTLLLAGCTSSEVGAADGVTGAEGSCVVTGGLVLAEYRLSGASPGGAGRGGHGAGATPGQAGAVTIRY